MIGEDWVGSALNLRGLVGKTIAAVDFYGPADVVVTCVDGVQAQLRIVEPESEETRDPLDRLLVRVVDGTPPQVAFVELEPTAHVETEILSL